jgi:Gram-negative bacterial TonB protein C-terminal
VAAPPTRSALVKISPVAFACVLLAALLALVANPSARAQEPQGSQSSQLSPLDALAAKMAEAISQSKNKRVTVFDFQGPGYGFTAIGQKLGDEFSAALSKAATNFKVMDRVHVPVDDGEFALLADPDFAYEQAQMSGSDGLVFGKLSLERDNLAVSLEFHRTKNKKKTFDLTTAIPVTDEMKQLAQKHIGENSLSGYPHGGDWGYSMPACNYCPRADMTDELVKHAVATGETFKGIVILEVLVGVDGSPQKIRIVKDQPYGLTDKAIQAVLKWKFKPANGPDGNPAAVIVPIEVQFHLR